jgi:uncharacterized protein YndB with AHSA1/START domain
MEISIMAEVRAPIARVWECWTKPEHITRWNFAADSWHCPSAVNDLKPGGEFSWRMEARDGSMGFDYKGKYTEVIKPEHIAFKLDDGRKVDVAFLQQEDHVLVVETFEPENENEIELQRQGWQMILNNFKFYVESKQN